MNSHGRTQRRSLKESLRSILRRRRDSGSEHLAIGSGILKRHDPSLVLLPSVSGVSLLPNFESSRFDIDQYSVSTIGCGADTQESVQAFGRSNQSLLPKTSLSQFGIDLNNPYEPQSLSHQFVPARIAQGVNGYETSIYGSVTTLNTLKRSTSTLRLQRSTQTLRAPTIRDHVSHYVHSDSRLNLERLPSPSPSIPQSLRKRPSNINEYRRPAIPDVPRIVEHPPSRASSSDQSESAIDHFSSFCVLDTFTPGCPVTTTSKDLRYVFDIGEQFCLNSQGVEGASMDTVTGSDAEGNTITHLVLYSPLISPSSGRSRFVLASLIDVTPFLRDAASLPDLDTISEESVVEEELRTPPKWSTGREVPFKLSAESLLSGCCLPERMPETPTRKQSHDIWLDIATEEKKRSRSSSRPPSGSTTPQTYNSSLLNPSVDDMLDSFIADLQELYAEFFILGKSPFDENSYEICNVSPKLYASREYIEGHLSHTSTRSKIHLEKQLTYEESFSMQVRWGNEGVVKRMFCIPLFGRFNVTWACFLVDAGIGQTLPTW